MYAQKQDDRLIEPNRREERRFKKRFPFALTDREALAIHDRAADLIEEIVKTELDFTESKKVWREKLGGLKTTLRETLATARARKEVREIEVAEVYDYDRFVVELVDETGEVREVRPMTGPERQGELGI